MYFRYHKCMFSFCIIIAFLALISILKFLCLCIQIIANFVDP
ncbi:hypothetical protein HMPREF1981_03157 [Bacteroides pyogenes F0041]|uniref:Uncharacterized protein n=1 Tax=Bacteroides pyogenes F0041 TaxID=1321819 RepID=U2BTH1_9BACE|nr:hypothetical protein HMPREF1981_03157 [Bacteroides pyogenes F0041]